MPRVFALFAFAILFAFPAQAKVRLIEAGIVCPVPREATDRRPAPETETGFIDIINQQIEFDLPDRQVPMMRHLSFGLRIELKPGQPETEITIVVEHPPTGEAGLTRESWTQWIAGGERSLNMFTFDFDYEMVPGPWTFIIEIDGAPQIEVPFQVGDRFSNARIDEVCLEDLSS